MYVADGNLHVGEVLQAQAHVWNHLFNFINSMSLKCDVQLGIPDVIHNHGKPMSLSELVAVLPIHPTKARCVYRLMRILVHPGFFAQRNVGANTEGEGYVLTNASQLLIKNNPLRITSLFLAMLDPIFTEPWHYVVANLGGSENLKYLGGEMFKAVPQADAILMKWNLHNWNDEDCVKILEQCKEAIKGRAGGKLIIIDMVAENSKEVEESTETQLLFDKLMMILFTGRERNKKE